MWNVNEKSIMESTRVTRAIPVVGDSAWVAERLQRLGVSLLRRANLNAGIELLRKAIGLDPRNANAQFNLGNALLQGGALADALSCYDRAIDVDGTFHDAKYNRALVLVKMERFHEALGDYDAVLHESPLHARAHANRGNVLRELKRYEEALDSYDSSLRLLPNNPEALCGRGAVLHDLLRYDEALQSYGRSLQLRPDYSEALSNRGATLRRLYRHQDALADHDHALFLKPRNIETLVNKGNVLREMGRVGEALQCFLDVQSIDPNANEGHMGEFFCRHLLGQLEISWRKYEWRTTGPKSPLQPRRFREPLWLGEFDLAGKVILLHAEQGYGDIVQFCRYAKKVSLLGATVLLEVPQTLEALLTSLEGVDRLVVRGADLPCFDCHCPLMSLPLVFETGLHNIPAEVPYLHCSEEKRSQWASRLGNKRGTRIGLAWSGNPDHDNDMNRSIALRDFAGLVSPGREFVCLQKEIRESDCATLGRLGTIRSYCDDLSDFCETAGLIANMDIVISVDTSIAHLAAAMGKPTWIMLPFNVEWRWLLDRDDSPWYPTVRLFRQTTPGDWHALVARLARNMPV